MSARVQSCMRKFTGDEETWWLHARLSFKDTAQFAAAILREQGRRVRVVQEYRRRDHIRLPGKWAVWVRDSDRRAA